MSATPDPLAGATDPDRPFYATGVLLDAEDFSAEQTYHRRQLARALLWLHGSGTVAGLRVVHEPAIEEGAGVEAREERLLVRPGLAVDSMGRLIEVPATLCLRLGRWYDGQTPADLRPAWRGGDFNGVVADLFLYFHACERGKTPAFARGPFDATDAVAPARLRDAPELRFVLRTEDPPPLPARVWPDPDAPLSAEETERWPDLAALPDDEDRADALARRRFQETLLDAWPDEPDEVDAGPQGEFAAGQDRTGVFLARVVIPADEGGAAERPPRRAEPVRVDNYARLFLPPAQALAFLSGL